MGFRNSELPSIRWMSLYQEHNLGKGLPKLGFHDQSSTVHQSMAYQPAHNFHFCLIRDLWPTVVAKYWMENSRNNSLSFMLHTILISMMKLCFSPNLPGWDWSPVDPHCIPRIGNLVAIFVSGSSFTWLSQRCNACNTICCYYYHYCVCMMHICGYSGTGQRSTLWSQLFPSTLCRI